MKNQNKLVLKKNLTKEKVEPQHIHLNNQAQGIYWKNIGPRP